MNDIQPIRLTSHADLVTAIPLLLGFIPDLSLVTVGTADGTVTGVFRADLPGDAASPHRLAPVTAQARRSGCDTVALVAYGPTRLTEAAMGQAEADMREAGLPVAARLRVADDRFFCDDARDGCCPPEGGPVPETTAATLPLAVGGATVCPTREAVAALLDPAEPNARAATAAAIDAALITQCDLDWGEQRAADLHTIDHWLTATTLPGPDDIASLALAVGDLQVRDYAMAVSEPHLQTGSWPVDLWLWVTRHVEDDMFPPCATLLAWFAYRSHNPVLALESLAKALETQPGYRLASMLLEAIQMGIAPHQIPVREPAYYITAGIR